MEFRKLTHKVDVKLAKQFKILAVELDTTMNKLIEQSMRNTIKKHERKQRNGYITFGQYSIKSAPNQKITRADRDDTTTVDKILPIKKLTGV